MDLRIPETPLKRMAVAIGAAVAVMVAAALVYLLLAGGSSPAKIDGVKIVAAGHAFTRALVAGKQPLPKTVSLTELVAHGFLKPEDVAAFQGLDAALVLTYEVSNPQKVLMRVHMPDGSDLVLLGDGSAQQVPR